MRLLGRAIDPAGLAHGRAPLWDAATGRFKAQPAPGTELAFALKTTTTGNIPATNAAGASDLDLTINFAMPERPVFVEMFLPVCFVNTAARSMGAGIFPGTGDVVFSWSFHQSAAVNEIGAIRAGLRIQPGVEVVTGLGYLYNPGDNVALKCKAFVSGAAGPLGTVQGVASGASTRPFHRAIVL